MIPIRTLVVDDEPEVVAVNVGFLGTHRSFDVVGTAHTGTTALAQITVGKDTRDTVAEIVGRPSAAGLLNDEGWYYVQSRYRHFGARRPEEIERQVVAISFTPNGTVENVERFGLEQGKVVPLSRRVTESNIKGVSLIGQLLGNIGQFRADQFIPQEER